MKCRGPQSSLHYSFLHPPPHTHMLMVASYWIVATAGKVAEVSYPRAQLQKRMKWGLNQQPADCSANSYHHRPLKLKTKLQNEKNYLRNMNTCLAPLNRMENKKEERRGSHAANSSGIEPRTKSSMTTASAHGACTIPTKPPSTPNMNTFAGYCSFCFSKKVLFVIQLQSIFVSHYNKVQPLKS